MTRSLTSKSLAFTAVAALVLATVAGLLSAPPAQAAPPPVILAAAGADVTNQVMDSILSTSAGQYNIPTLPTTPYVVPGDANCSTTGYVQSSPGAGQAIAPISAGTGLNALKANETAAAGQTGCIDIARSSAPPRGLASDPASFEYYAFALDAVSWASPSLQAPATLTLPQLQGIYNCTYTDWAQVGGGSGPIQRYFTQVGSGTGSFFQSDLLGGFDPTTVSTSTPPAGSTFPCPAVKRIQQSEGTSIDDVDYQEAILPYSAGNWIYQANNKVNPTVDVRNGVRLGGITNGTDPSVNDAGWDGLDGVWQANSIGANAPVQEKNVKLNNPAPGFFPGIRYVFNVIDNVSPSYPQAQGVVAFVNTPSGALSPLCSGTFKSTLSSFGFAPLSSTLPSGVAAGTDLAGATCRKYTN